MSDTQATDAKAMDAQAKVPIADHIMQFFEWQHLPPHLQMVSMEFQTLAKKLLETVPRNPERTVALRKLLEAKDAAVRAQIARD